MLLRRRQRRTVLRAALAGLILLAGGGSEAQVATPARHTIPVFDLETPGYTLAVEVDEVGGTGHHPVAELPAAVASADEADRVAVAYAAGVLAGDLDGVRSLYPEEGVDEAEIRKKASFLHTVLTSKGKPASLRVVKSWLFGTFRVSILEVVSEGGSATEFAVGLRRAGGRWRCADDWGEQQPVQLLFWYMTSNYKKGLAEDRPRRELPHELTLVGPAPVHPLTVRFAGVLYPKTDTWAELGGEAPAPDDPVLAFVERALELSSSGTDQEFLDLFAGEDRRKMEAFYTRSPGRVEGLRDRLAVETPVRHLATLELGDFRAHYLVARGQPARVRTVVFRQTDDGFSIATDLHANIEAFATSTVVRRGVLEAWSGQGE